LNQTANLIVSIKNSFREIKDFEIKVELPEGLELIKGDLTWRGDFPINRKLVVIDTLVKSVKTGSWTINVTYPVDPKLTGGLWDKAYNPIYVLILENSAEWRVNGNYPPPGSTPLPPGQAPATRAQSSTNK
jgi:hypothetical protein